MLLVSHLPHIFLVPVGQDLDRSCLDSTEFGERMSYLYRLGYSALRPSSETLICQPHSPEPHKLICTLPEQFILQSNVLQRSVRSRNGRQYVKIPKACFTIP